MKINKITLLLLSSSLCCTSAYANFYAGVGAGYSFLDNACSIALNCDDENATGNIHLGYNVNNHFAVEFNTDYLGEFSVNQLNNNEVTSKDLSLWGLSLAPKLSIPLSDAFALYGKLGGTYLMAGDETDIVTTASLGAEYKISRNTGLQLEYQRFENMTSHFVNNMDVNLVSLRFNYQFGEEASNEHVPATIESRPVTETITHTVPSQSNQIQFAFDTHEVELNEMLKSTIAILTTYPESVVEVKGHTDSTGPVQYNQTLSEKRAQFIADKIQKQGISNERITAYGVGEEQPISTNTTSQGRAENRRVDLTVPEFKYKQTIIKQAN